VCKRCQAVAPLFSNFFRGCVAVAATVRKPRKRDPNYLSRRDYAVKRRCDQWGVPFERVSRAAVWKASGWLCGLCRNPVDSRLRWPHPLSKSLDHVIPLSVPGSPGHVFSNCQLSHLTCNTRKGGVNRM
jgi:5-methylcytosine-specific restriction endonuclease McrA